MNPNGKHIVIVTHYYPPHIGGIEIVAYNQAKYLSQAGHTVTIVTSAIGGVINGYDLPGVRVVRVPALNPFEKLSIPFPIFSPSIISILRREIKKADIVHIHDAFYLSSFFAAKAALRFNKPAVLTQHVELINHPRAIVMGIQKLVYNTTGNVVFRACKKIITYNARVTEFLLTRGISKEKIVTVQNGVDTETFHPVDLEQKRLLKASLGLPLAKKIVLFVGRYVPKKGFDKVLAARGPEYEIVCTGGNTPTEVYEHVTFLGKVTQKKLAEVYQAADIFLLPSESEGFPLSIQEAMASGLPIITTNDEGYREYDLDPSLIALLDQPSGATIRTILLSLVDDEQRLAAMSLYSHAYANAQFSWPTTTKRLEQIYDKITEQKQTLSVANPVYVTTSWDDGHVLDVRLGALLEKYGIAGTFYISPEDEEQKKTDLLTPEEIKALSEKFEIGAHTIHHKRLPELTDDEARKEITDSKTYLETVTGKPVISFCYPCGDYRERHVQMVKDAGFDYARTIDRHALSIGRPLESTTTVHTYNHLSDAGAILRLVKYNLGKFFKYVNNWDELAIAQFDRARQTGGVFHLWGHSWEIEQHGDWDRLERVLAHIAHQSGVEYLTNTELAHKEKNKPATILMAAPYFPPHLGGTQLYVYNIAKRLKQSGVNVIIAATGERGFSKVKKTVYEGMTVYRLPYWLKLSNTPVNPLWYFHFRKIIKDEHVDIVNAHTPVPLFADIAARASFDTHFFVTYHGGSLHKGKPLVDWIIWVYEHLLLWPLLNRAEKIICTSDFVRNDFLKKYLHKSVTITPGVDTDLFHPAAEKTPHEKTRLLFVASLTSSEQYKGLSTLIEAAKELRKKTDDFSIAVVGDGDMKREYEARVNEMGLNEFFLFKGRMMGEALAEMYQSADIFVHPTSMEAFGMVIAEAMASGLPVVSTTVGGIPLLVKEGENGFLVPPANQKMLAEKIDALIHDPALAKEYGENGRTIATKNFNWNTRARSYDELYTHCLSQQNQNYIQAKRNIAFVSDGVYPFSKGGRERRLFDISARLVEDGYRVTIYTMKWWDGPVSIMQNGVTLYAISPLYPLYVNGRRSIKSSVLFAWQCLKLFRKKFDVVDVDHIPHTVLFTIKIICLLKGKRLIATWHEVWGKQYWQKYLGKGKGWIAYISERIAAHLPHTIIAVSNQTAEALREKLGVRREIVAIPNGLDTQFIKNAPLHIPSSDVVYTGRLISHKHIDVLLEAMVMLRERNRYITLVIIGDGPDTDMLKQKSHELGLDDCVTFTGIIEEDAEVYGIMHASKVFVLPSEREGFGIVVTEANASGIPVVTVDMPDNAAKHLIVQGENGLVCELSPESIAAAIETLLHDRKNATYYASFAEQYDWKIIIPQMEEVYGK